MDFQQIGVVLQDKYRQKGSQSTNKSLDRIIFNMTPQNQQWILRTFCMEEHRMIRRTSFAVNYPKSDYMYTYISFVYFVNMYVIMFS